MEEYREFIKTVAVRFINEDLMIYFKHINLLDELVTHLIEDMFDDYCNNKSDGTNCVCINDVARYNFIKELKSEIAMEIKLMNDERIYLKSLVKEYDYA